MSRDVMAGICAICEQNPDSHSFKKIKEKNGVSVFYAKPSAGKLYKDTDGILTHINNALAANGDKKWICIIDGEGFDIRHAAEVTTGMALFELITQKYGTKLVEIKLINPTWHIKCVINAVRAFASEELQSKLTVLDDRPYSVLQFV